MKYDFKVINREACYKGFFKLERLQISHTLFSGGWCEPVVRELIHKRHAVAALMYDPELDSVVMVEQFRVGTMEKAPEGNPQRAWTLELVAGFMEEDESIEQVIHREAEEESGCIILEMLPVYTFHASPGNSSETTSLYCCKIDASNAGGVFGLADEGEDIRAHVLKLDDAIAQIETGRINTVCPIIALQWLEKNRDMIKDKWRDS